MGQDSHQTLKNSQMSPEEPLLAKCMRRCSSHGQPTKIVSGAMGAEENAHQISITHPRWNLKLHQMVQHRYSTVNYAKI
jgi:hypothetical protein